MEILVVNSFCRHLESILGGDFFLKVKPSRTSSFKFHVRSCWTTEPEAICPICPYYLNSNWAEDDVETVEKNEWNSLSTDKYSTYL